ncbi:tetratricopeptide repeat protein [Candidatus Pelagibacter sp.]|uniref:tetratricopeptide repeat protein n=1 Tax=Candidatus Pelagibacter sp. TaxID=2024849 RepID=UPI003F83E2A2
MIKKIFVILIFTLFTTNSFSAGSSSDSTSTKVKSNYDKAVESIKFAKKYEAKGKLEKAKKRYVKAQKLLLKSNSEKPNKADTLNYLGFTTRKLGDYENGEKYYLQGLEIEPNHIGINEYLGELYVATNRLNLAKERLKILENCNCKEYTQLKEVIEGTKKSKY